MNWRKIVLQSLGWDVFLRTLSKPTQDLWKAEHPDVSPVASLADVLAFCSTSRRHGKVSAGSRSKLESMWHSLLQKVAQTVDCYVFDVYGVANDLRKSPKVLRTAANRLRGRIDAETAWAVLTRSREVFGQTPETVVAVKSDEKHLSGVNKIAGWRSRHQGTA